MFHDLTKAQKRALREAARLAAERDHSMQLDDREVHYLKATNSSLPIVVAGAVSNGVLKLEDVGEAARPLIEDLARRLDAVREATESTVQEEPADPHDPSAVISIAALVREFDAVRDGVAMYVDRVTGRIEIIDQETMDLADEEPEDEDLDDLADWERENLELAREIVSSESWIAVASRDDIHDLEIMRRFARRQRPAASAALEDATRGRGLHRRFRDTILRFDLQKEWDAFRNEWIADHFRFVLEEIKIPFRR